jgi:subtilisin family serine protease
MTFKQSACAVGVVCLSLGLIAAGCAVKDEEESASDAAQAPPGAAASSEPSSATHRSFVPGQVIVKFRDEVPETRRMGSYNLGVARARYLRDLSEGATLWTVDGADSEEDTLAAVEALRALPEVEYAHENGLMSLFSVPTDPDYPLQWNYPAINLPAAWNVVTGNVTIAVIDTGELAHPDLSSKWTTTGHNFGDNLSPTDPTDTYSWHHGLHVAGILAASTNNGIGGAGICWGCSLMPIKIEQDVYGDINMADVGQAITWATQNGARVINMSFGTINGTSPCSKFSYIQQAVTSANNAGVVVVAAAGNNAASTANVTPASCTGVIAVAASDRNNALAAYSNNGSRVDITAPGGGSAIIDGELEPEAGNGLGCPADGTLYSGTTGVVSSWAVYQTGTQLTSSDYCYRYLSGTSMASPHVAGVAALLKSQFPSMAPSLVAQRIHDTAQPIPGCGANCGGGLVNAGAAVYAANDSPCKEDGDMCMATSNECHLKGGIVMNLPCRNGQVCCGL